MASTTSPPTRLGPALDDPNAFWHCAKINVLRTTDPPTKWAEIARQLELSPSRVARLRRLKFVAGHVDTGHFVIWLPALEIGGEARLVGKVEKSTTLKESSAAKWPDYASAAAWLNANRYKQCIGGTVIPHKFNPIVVDLTTP